MKTMTLKVPAYVKDYIEKEAKRCGVTPDQMAAYFFAHKVVHT